MRQVILNIFLFLAIYTYSQDTIYNRNSVILIDNHNPKDTSFSFGKKIDNFLMTVEVNKKQFKKLAIKTFGNDYDSNVAREAGIYFYIKKGVTVTPTYYYKKINSIELDISYKYTEEIFNNYPMQKLTAYDLIKSLGRPQKIFTNDFGLESLLYRKGKLEIYFRISDNSYDQNSKTPNELRVSNVKIWYNKNGN